MFNSDKVSPSACDSVVILFLHLAREIGKRGPVTPDRDRGGSQQATHTRAFRQ